MKLVLIMVSVLRVQSEEKVASASIYIRVKLVN